ncbi:MAG TPA: hypothetical protein VLN44_05225, partial [Pyrinomonadaceae bacterium]|nr:hypothetical protein [Pyrinomonadaceae bacterium]
LIGAMTLFTSLLGRIAITNGIGEGKAIAGSAVLSIVLALGVWLFLTHRRSNKAGAIFDASKDYINGSLTVILLLLIVPVPFILIGVIYQYGWVIFIVPTGIVTLLIGAAVKDFILPAFTHQH